MPSLVLTIKNYIGVAAKYRISKARKNVLITFFRKNSLLLSRPSVAHSIMCLCNKQQKGTGCNPTSGSRCIRYCFCLTLKSNCISIDWKSLMENGSTSLTHWIEAQAPSRVGIQPNVNILTVCELEIKLSSPVIIGIYF